MIEYACINTRKSIQEKLHHKRFQSSTKINRMLITRLICIQWKFTTVYSHAIEVFTEVFTCFKVMNALKRKNSWTDPFRKSSTSFASIFSKLSSQNKAISTSLLARTHKKMKRLHFYGLAALIKQTRLIRFIMYLQITLNPSWLLLKMKWAS